MIFDDLHCVDAVFVDANISPFFYFLLRLLFPAALLWDLLLSRFAGRELN
jgi:hypothetical protein